MKHYKKQVPTAQSKVPYLEQKYEKKTPAKLPSSSRKGILSLILWSQSFDIAIYLISYKRVFFLHNTYHCGIFFFSNCIYQERIPQRLFLASYKFFIL